MTNKIVVYTCIIDKYDSLKEVKEKEEGIDYLCFTDKEILSKTWNVIKISNILNIDSERLSRYPKILPHLFLEEYDISIWIDGSIQVRGNIHELLKSLNDTNFYISKHPSRNCIYKEAEVVICRKLDYEPLIVKQMSAYQKEGFPLNFGLAACGIIIRRHNDPKCISIANQWWHEVITFSKRDQLSFNYVMWKNPDFRLNYFKEHYKNFVLDSKYFKYVGHNSKKIKGEIQMSQQITLHDTSCIPQKELHKRYDIINFFIERFQYKKYLEIGVCRRCQNFNKIVCEYKKGIDPDKKAEADFLGTSDQFFVQNTEKFDIILVDGLHYRKQVVNDVKNALNCLNENGTIICHDILPSNEEEQLIPMPKKARFWTGDCWKAWLFIRSYFESVEMFVVNTDRGVGIIRQGKQQKIIINEELDWNFFTKNKPLFNIISIEQLKEKYK